MVYWAEFSSFNRGIVEAFSKLNNNKFVLVDGGAAGSISAPFDIAERVIEVVRFEPRGETQVEVAKNDIYIDGGLWSEDGAGSLHGQKL